METEHRTPEEIMLYCAAILQKMGLPLTLEEMEQFKPMISESLISFIILKQKIGEIGDQND